MEAPAERKELRHFDLAEQAGRGDRRLDLPMNEVARPGGADHAAAVAGADRRAGGEPHAEAVAGGIGRDPWVTQRPVVPERRVELFVEARIEVDDRACRMPAPLMQVGRCGKADALLLAVLGARRAGVEEIPKAVVAEDRSGPGRAIVPRRFGGRREAGAEIRPRAQVRRDGMADGDVPMRGAPGRRGCGRPAERRGDDRRRPAPARSPIPNGRRGRSSWQRRRRRADDQRPLHADHFARRVVRDGLDEEIGGNAAHALIGKSHRRQRRPDALGEEPVVVEADDRKIGRNAQPKLGGSVVDLQRHLIVAAEDRGWTVLPLQQSRAAA